ncbi:DUF3037 domain-containing protein [Bradyrhizobium sp. YCK136]|uniref:DUF3037 domain-containing protein n=1 Tax=Bradyrhizobium sp. YCK136 TaxID=3351346 RepID=UPI0037C944BC
MARTFEFAVLRLVPDLARGESINLGVIVFHDSSVDISVGEVLTRARILFPELNESELKKSLDVLKRLGSAPLSARERHRALSKIGAFALGELGSFTVNEEKPEAYSAQIAMLLSTFVATPRSSLSKIRASSKLATEVRKVFRREKVLAAIGDAGALSEHKIVPEWPIPSRPSIRADLALMNGIMRVCELVDLDLEEDGPPPPALFAGVVTLDVAQREVEAKQRVFAYRAKGPAARIDEALAIAKMHASEIIDWEKTVEREKFVHEWITAAYSPPKEGATR